VRSWSGHTRLEPHWTGPRRCPGGYTKVPDPRRAAIHALLRRHGWQTADAPLEPMDPDDQAVPVADGYVRIHRQERDDERSQ